MDFGELVATWLMMRRTKTTCVWMRLAMLGTNSAMKLSMGTVAGKPPYAFFIEGRA